MSPCCGNRLLWQMAHVVNLAFGLSRPSGVRLDSQASNPEHTSPPLGISQCAQCSGVLILLEMIPPDCQLHLLLNSYVFVRHEMKSCSRSNLREISPPKDAEVAQQRSKPYSRHKTGLSSILALTQITDHKHNNYQPRWECGVVCQHSCLVSSTVWPDLWPTSLQASAIFRLKMLNFRYWHNFTPSFPTEPLKLDGVLSNEWSHSTGTADFNKLLS